MHTGNTGIKTILLLVLAGGLAGCFDADDTRDAAKAGSAAASGAESCLVRAEDTPCDLLSADILAQFAPADVELRSQELARQQLCQANWEGGRIRSFEVAGRKIEAPVSDALMLGSISRLGDTEADAARRFEARRSTPSQAKKDAMTAEAQGRVDGAVDPKYKDMANDFASRLMNSIEFEPVAGLGDAAAWGGPGKSKQLWVRLGRYEFTLRLERSNDPETLKQDNVELARALVASCS